MTRTVTALFDSRSEAEAARQRLTESSIDAERVRIIANGSEGGSPGGDAQSDQGFWASLRDLFIPDDDRQAYGEGISRGAYLLTAEVDEQEADRAISILDETGSVDFDQRQEEWRSSGWSGSSGQGNSDTLAGGIGYETGRAGADYDSGELRSTGERDEATSARDDRNVVEETRIPIVEEQLRVGKREVERGGARVRSYIRETPVHEQVNLREEHVSVERRPVDERLSSADLDRGDFLGERNIEMTETAEEAVVGKEARVREELVVRKTAEEHVENIDDSVRHTEVEVDEGRRNEDRSALFGGRDSERGDLDADRTDEQSSRDRVETDRDRGY